ncbi:uncharacterized protein LOC126795117 [Argentina anserina]|uniref:uncharacterized protein LOC126795117 n=1 Tax=Argentina anserina TaxID=57926 RepID=UPI0021766C0B|nr:uncharacterized protein LOC126795117 [Potentilla anserina]
MAELVLGAVLGAAFTVLQEAVNKATVGKFKKCKPLLGALQSTLDSIQPLVIQQIGEYNEKLKLPNDEIEALDRQMREGEYLIRKLSKLGWWNHIRSRHTRKLIELNGSLQRLLKHIVMQQARDIKENLIVTKQTKQQIAELQEDTRRFALALQDSGKQLVEFQELNERLLQERMLLQEGARDSQKTLFAALEENGKQLVHLHGVIEKMMKQQGSKGATDAETDDSDDEWLKPNEEEDDLVALSDLLYEGVRLLFDKDVMDKPVLKSIESTLAASLPPLKEVSRPAGFNVNEMRVEAVMIRMREGVKLFRQCSNLQTWNMYRKFKYANKLIQWDESLRVEINILLTRKHKSEPTTSYASREKKTQSGN